MQMRTVFVTLALALAASARPAFDRRADFTLKNGQDAIALNEKFKTLTANSPCQAGEDACINQQFAQCVNGKFVTQACAPGTICSALPLVNKAGTSITCTTEADAAARIAATGAQAGGNTGGNNNNGGGGAAGNGNANAGNAGAGDANAGNAGAGGANTGNAGAGGAAGNAGDNTGNNNNNAGAGGAAGNSGSGDAQTSLTLDPSVIAKGFANDGQAQPAAGQVSSLTSTNNFINFCLTVPNLPLTDGKQIADGSCNPAPMGAIPSKSKMPSSKFVFPANGATVPANQKFTIQMAIKNLDTGFFVNAQENYFAAPQQLNGQGIIQGHSHVVVEQLASLDQTTPTDPNVFAFFKGLNGKADGKGILTADVTEGLPAGVYKLSSINAAANHQPVLAPIAQHGSLDDAVYFTVQ
ncbi:hypothetical protein D9756_003993 [Leucocoprinus leucothites]|uniref:Carbohydrate-binding module family 19 domain-containing protein n=1 Tax=Leucocoprinus leucothites TaxID=201217 RepID=A0A8H5D9U2_9AGAR|nr:hypothetical protein D9756_003993 [Leucoagaricus leucothites]